MVKQGEAENRGKHRETWENVGKRGKTEQNRGKQRKTGGNIGKRGKTLENMVKHNKIAGFQCHAIQNRSKSKSTSLNR